jgi:vacuolar-type H+-ATPase subunit I/STV1
MKYTITLSLCLFVLTSFAQKIKVTESDERIGGGNNPALVVNIYNSTADEVASKWKSLMKEYKGKVKMDNEIKSDNTVISTINDNNTIDIYAKIEKGKDNELFLTVAFNLGGAFLSSSNNKDKLTEAKKFIHDFAVNVSKEGVIEQRKEAEKLLTNLQDEEHTLEKKQDRLVSNTEDYKKKIEEYKQKIKETEDNAAKNKTEQEKKKQEIEVQKKAVEAIMAREKAVE